MTVPESLSLKILVVDDEPVVLDLLVELLSFAAPAAAVLTAATAATALAILAAHSIALIITDHTLPDRSGIDLAGAIRERWPDVPIVLMSWGEPALVMRAQRMQVFAGILRKPFHLGELRALIQGVLPAAASAS